MKAYLLDTHIFLWWCTNDSRLYGPTTQILENRQNRIFISVASAWEVAIKQGLGRLKLPGDFEQAVVENEFEKLPITFEHAKVAGALPAHHRDPFDRMLVAQTLCEDLIFITGDRALEPYGASFSWN